MLSGLFIGVAWLYVRLMDAKCAKVSSRSYLVFHGPPNKSRAACWIPVTSASQEFWQQSTYTSRASCIWFHATSANLSVTTIATFFASLLCFTHCSAFKTDSHNSFWFWNSCRALGRSVCNTPAKLLGEHWANMLWDQALAEASSINSKTKLRSLSVSSFNHSGCSPSVKSSGSTPKSTARNRFKEL